MLLYFGLIRPYKGVEVLLKAMRQLADLKNLKLYVVGEVYSNREGITSLVNQLPKECVRLIDKYVPNEEVSAWFRAADLVVLPYLSATQSGVIPIAYNCNRPVLATRTGGLPDVVLDGLTGYLVEPGDENALAKCIKGFFTSESNPDMTAGIEKMCKQLSWSGYVSEMTEFIKNQKVDMN